MRVRNYLVDPRHNTTGVPTSFGTLTLNLLSEQSDKLLALTRFQVKKYRSFLMVPAGEVDPEISRQIDIEKASAAVTGWDGAVDEAGELVPFSVDALGELLSEDPFLRADVLRRIGQAENFRKQDVVHLGKLLPLASPTP